MKDKKFQVFVSSTFIDLKEERKAAVEAILSTGNIPAGMELFSAGDESQMKVINRWIDESDIYLLILGGRYGSIEKKTGKSYTQLEYEYALSKNKPLFAVVISEKALDKKIKTQGRTVIEQENPKYLTEFRSLVLNNLIKYWEDTKDIKIAIHETLAEFSFRKDLIGWIRGDNSVNTGFLAEEIARLTKENFELRNKLSNSELNTSSLYSGLTYLQLEELLKRESIEDFNGIHNLFEYMLSIGLELSTGYLHNDSIELDFLNKLTLYKLISDFYEEDKFPIFYGDFKINPLMNFRGKIFTESGHNFYLKSLLLSSKFSNSTGSL